MEGNDPCLWGKLGKEGSRAYQLSKNAVGGEVEGNERKKKKTTVFLDHRKKRGQGHSLQRKGNKNRGGETPDLERKGGRH